MCYSTILMDQMMEGLKTSAWHWSGQKNEDRHRPRSLGQKKTKRTPSHKLAVVNLSRQIHSPHSKVSVRERKPRESKYPGSDPQRRQR